MRGLTPWQFAILLIGAVATIALVGVAFEYYDARHEDERIRASQVRACEASLKPGGVRYEIATDKQAEAERTKQTPASFFPNIPRKEFDRLIAESVKQEKTAAARLLSIDCEAQYPRP